MYELTNFMVIKWFLWSMHNKSQFSHDYLYDINTRSYLALPPKAKQSWLLDSRFRPDAFCENYKIFIYGNLHRMNFQICDRILEKHLYGCTWNFMSLPQSCRHHKTHFKYFYSIFTVLEPCINKKKFQAAFQS